MSVQPNSFEEAKARLEEIADAVGNDELPLDEALDLFDEAVSLGLAVSDLMEEGIEVDEPDEPGKPGGSDAADAADAPGGAGESNTASVPDAPAGASEAQPADGARAAEPGAGDAGARPSE